MDRKRLLGEVFCAGLTSRRGVGAIAKRLGQTETDVRRQVSSLRREGLVEGSSSRPRLTDRGRRRIKVVFTGGSFEIMHPGHLYTIDQAKKLGDVLVVVLARSSTIRSRKGRDPVADEAERLALMLSLRQVDAAILGSEGSIYETLKRVGPDVVALGYDQYHAEADIRREAAAMGIRLRVVRLKALNADFKTSKILAEFL